MARNRLEIGRAGWLRTGVSAAVGVIYFLPVLWIVVAAFKPPRDALTFGLDFTPTLDNFFLIFRRALFPGGEVVNTGFEHFFFNSIFVAATSVGAALILGTAAAYGFSRWPLKGNDLYMFIILTTRMLPPIIIIIPIFVMFRLTGLAGSYLGIILLYTAFNLPFTIWMMKSFFDELPRDVEDAARTEGSSEWRVFFRVCLPQVKAGIAATVTFGLILTWNEFIMALLLTGSTTRTVPVSMGASRGGGVNVQWGQLAAIETLYLLPVVLVTFVLQRQLLRGVTFGTIRTKA